MDTNATYRGARCHASDPMRDSAGEHVILHGDGWAALVAESEITRDAVAYGPGIVDPVTGVTRDPSPASPAGTVPLSPPVGEGPSTTYTVAWHWRTEPSRPYLDRVMIIDGYTTTDDIPRILAVRYSGMSGRVSSDAAAGIVVVSAHPET